MQQLEAALRLREHLQMSHVKEKWNALKAVWKGLEKEMSLSFATPSPEKKWRDGCKKQCFTYLLLDPRITQDLPLV